MDRPWLCVLVHVITASSPTPTTAEPTEHAPGPEPLRTPAPNMPLCIIRNPLCNHIRGTGHDSVTCVDAERPWVNKMSESGDCHPNSDWRPARGGDQKHPGWDFICCFNAPTPTPKTPAPISPGPPGKTPAPATPTPAPKTPAAIRTAPPSKIPAPSNPGPTGGSDHDCSLLGGFVGYACQVVMACVVMAYMAYLASWATLVR